MKKFRKEGKKERSRGRKEAKEVKEGKKMKEGRSLGRKEGIKVATETEIRSDAN